MALTSGTRLGPYEILGALGAGGMGEVYKARDPRLGREVAIKVLPSSFSDDPDRLRRFEQEARAAAALNHPGILAVFDLGSHDGSPYIVSELLAGETLRARLATDALPLRKAIEYAIQVARALAAAHDKGILHRDLKPENVFLTTDGHVKILDFGLAKLIEPDAAHAGTTLPTVTAGTEPGMMMGTMGYMAPEQVRGQPVDHRTDLFAFGALLYEMVSGQRAFAGATAADTISAVLEKHPSEEPLTERHVPAGLGRIVDRCLEKSPIARFQSTRDLTFALEALNLDALSSASGGHAAQPAARTASVGMWRFAAFAFAVAAVGLAWPALRYFEQTPPEAVTARFGVDTPPTPESYSFALSADGRHLAFVATVQGVPRVWIRPLDQVTAQPLAGTDGASGVFWSPDARSVGFFADNKLKRVDLTGGAPLVLADAPLGRGGTWSREGVIVFAPTTTSGLSRVAATGGAATPLTNLAPGQGSHRWPQFVPDGRHFLYFSALGQQATHGVYLGSLDGGEPIRVAPSETAGLYAAPGYLLLASQGVLVARRFDAARGTLSGEPVPVAQSVGMDDGTLHGAFATSEGGVIAYRSGVGGNRRQLVWIDRTGKVLGTLGAPDETSLASPALSPDGRYVAVARSAGGSADIWLIEVARASVSRFTSDPDADQRPIWSPDSSRVMFASTRTGRWTLFEKPANRSRDEQPVTGIPQSNVNPLDWSSDGRFVLYAAQDPKTGADLWALPMTGDRTPIPIATTSFDETQGEFSPDGHWAAYASNETGRNEVYVRRFPDGSGGQVSIDGGRFPRWRRDGGELFFVAPDNRLMAAPLHVSADGRTPAPGVPVALFATRLATGANVPPSGYVSRAQYVVLSDGRFLMNVSLEDVAAPPIMIVLNWAAALARK